MISTSLLKPRTRSCVLDALLDLLETYVATTEADSGLRELTVDASIRSKCQSVSAPTTFSILRSRVLLCVLKPGGVASLWEAQSHWSGNTADRRATSAPPLVVHLIWEDD